MKINGVEYRYPYLQVKFLKLLSNGPMTPTDLAESVKNSERWYDRLSKTTSSRTVKSMVESGLVYLKTERGGKRYYDLTTKGNIITKTIISYRVDPFFREPRMFQLHELTSGLPKELAKTSIETTKRRLGEPSEPPVFEKSFRWLGFGTKLAIEETGIGPKERKSHKYTGDIFSMFRRGDIDIGTPPIDGIAPGMSSEKGLEKKMAVLFGFGPQYLSSVVCWDKASCTKILYPRDSVYALQMQEQYENLHWLDFEHRESVKKCVEEFVQDQEKKQLGIYVDRPIREILMSYHPELIPLAIRETIDLVAVRHDVSPKLVKALLNRRGSMWQLIVNEVRIFRQSLTWLEKMPENFPWLDNVFPDISRVISKKGQQ